MNRSSQVVYSLVPLILLLQNILITFILVTSIVQKVTSPDFIDRLQLRVIKNKQRKNATKKFYETFTCPFQLFLLFVF
jgi:hypothetical protein